MKHTKAIVLVVVAVLAVGAFAIANMKGSSVDNADASASSTSDIGHKAFFSLVALSGYRAQIVRDDWPILANSHAPAAFVIDPEQTDILESYSDPQDNPAKLANNLMAWVHSGHTLIWLEGSENSGTFNSDLQHKLGFSPNGLNRRREIAPNSISEESKDITAISAVAQLKTMPPGFVPICSVGSSAFAAKRKYGKGTIYLVGDGTLVNNENLRRCENAAFAMSLLHISAPQNSVVWFFEPRHLFDKSLGPGATPWSVLSPAFHWSVYQSVFAALLAIIALGSRFGTPRLSGLPIVRTSAEYVDSMASLFQQARASQASFSTIYRQFVRDASRKVGAEPDASLDLLARLISTFSQTPPEATAKLLVDCEGVVAGATKSDVTIIDLVQRITALRKELGID